MRPRIGDRTCLAIAAYSIPRNAESIAREGYEKSEAKSSICRIIIIEIIPTNTKQEMIATVGGYDDI